MRLYLLAIMSLLQLGDLVSTWRMGADAVELNPLLGFGTHPSLGKLLLVKVVSVGLFWLLLHRSKSVRVPALLCVLFAVIVVSNLGCGQ